MEKIYIEEAQSFAWLGIIPGLIALMFGVFCVIQIGFKRQVGNRPAPNWLLVVLFIFTAAVSILLSTQRLKTSITNKAVTFDFGVFAGKQSIQLSNIKSIAVRQYDGVKEFSGWGVKSNSAEQSYTVSGDYGVEIELKTGGKKILIGTAKPDDMKKVISLYLNQPNL